MLQSKVKYNDTNNFCLISTSVAKPPETAYPGEELRASTAAGCSECVWSAHTSTTPHKVSLITQCLQTFSPKQAPQQMSWEAAAAPNEYLEKIYPFMGSFPGALLARKVKRKWQRKLHSRSNTGCKSWLGCQRDLLQLSVQAPFLPNLRTAMLYSKVSK